MAMVEKAFPGLSGTDYVVTSLKRPTSLVERDEPR